MCFIELKKALSNSLIIPKRIWSYSKKKNLEKCCLILIVCTLVQFSE